MSYSFESETTNSCKSTALTILRLREHGAMATLGKVLRGGAALSSRRAGISSHVGVRGGGCGVALWTRESFFFGSHAAPLSTEGASLRKV